MQPKDLIDQLVTKTGFPRLQIKAILQAEAELVAAELAQGNVSKSFMGTFKVVERQARVGRNPKSGEPMDIPARKIVRFVPKKDVAEQVAAAPVAAAS